AASLTTDQRGFNRVVQGKTSLTVDLGAYEFQSSPAATATALVSSQNPSRVVQTVTFTATVTGTTPGSNMPVGTVTFTIDGSAVATVALVNGVASFSTTFMKPGTRTVIAQYNGGKLGDITFSTSSATINQVVNGGGGIIVTGTDAGGGPEVQVFDATTETLKF